MNTPGQNKKKDIVEIYKETKDFKKAVILSGLPTLQAHIKLLSSGVLELKDKIRYSSKSGQLGAKAEEMFQKLMPEAVNANRVIKKNNENFDFLYGNLTINVKYSSIGNSKNRTPSYKISRMKGCDLVVAFLERKRGAELNNPIIAIFPEAFIDVNQFTLGVDSEKLKSFIVEEKDLAGTIKQYGGFIN
ncbi:hypothetical protein E4O05_01245 [Treponema sp. OMZ 787]|uniref:hypothetical protein n=1 Tax=Treponema sp. OMZ 787 TaxID=2563669 RepID=UPI0020A40A35|nr:hypothetical protein [Treponema sp. OMZ 787]UTC62569.1 hypothetical protein E4O05_01245 [Treponema sp. OMZ 787]